MSSLIQSCCPISPLNLFLEFLSRYVMDTGYQDIDNEDQDEDPGKVVDSEGGHVSKKFV
jgi:hypothetical protein